MDFLKILIATGLALGVSSCYQDYVPPVTSEPVLCLNALITAGYPIEPVVSHTWYFTDPDGGEEILDDAEVTVIVNGLPMPDNYIAAEGDDITITARHPVYGEATARVTVPEAPVISDVDFTPVIKEAWYGHTEGYEMLADIRFGYTVTVTVTDSHAGNNYYGVNYVWYSPHFEENDYKAVDFFAGRLDFESEPLFREHVDAWEDFMGENDAMFGFFTDRSFTGASRRLHLKFANASYYVSLPEWSEEMLDCGLTLQFHAVSESYYNYARYTWQRDSYQNDLAEMGLAEPVYGYSNVSTGAGVVAANSTATITVSMRDFLAEAIKK